MAASNDSIWPGGYGVARWLNEHGVAAFVLNYTTVPTPLETPPVLAVWTG